MESSVQCEAQRQTYLYYLWLLCKLQGSQSYRSYINGGTGVESKLPQDCLNIRAGEGVVYGRHFEYCLRQGLSSLIQIHVSHCTCVTMDLVKPCFCTA